MGELEGTLELKTVDAFEPEVTELVRFRTRFVPSISAAMSLQLSKSCASLYDLVDLAGIPIIALPSSTEICASTIISRGSKDSEVLPMWSLMIWCIKLYFQRLEMVGQYRVVGAGHLSPI